MASIPELTRAKEQVMHVLWRRGPSHVREVRAALPLPAPAPTTVSTTVRILEQKGFVSYEPVTWAVLRPNPFSPWRLPAQLAARGLAGRNHQALLQPFTFFFTLTRLAMLQNQFPVRRWKQWLVLPVLAAVFFVGAQPVQAQSVPGKNATEAERQAWKEMMTRNFRKARHDDSLATGGKTPVGKCKYSVKRRMARLPLLT